MASLVKTDGTSHVVRPENGESFTIEELQHYCGGYVERIPLKDGLIMYANEEGHIMGLDYNEPASKTFGHPIVGDVIIGFPAEVDGD